MKRHNYCGRVINTIERNIKECSLYEKWALKCAKLLREDELTILSLCFHCASIVSDKVHDPYEKWEICSACENKKICDEMIGKRGG